MVTYHVIVEIQEVRQTQNKVKGSNKTHIQPSKYTFTEIHIKHIHFIPVYLLVLVLLVSTCGSVVLEVIGQFRYSESKSDSD